MSTSRIDPKERLVPENSKPLPLPTEGVPRAAARSALVGGLLWMVFGPMMLFLSTIALVIKAEGFFTRVDIYYVLALGSMMAGRWLEFYSGGMQTSDGKPASARDLYRYSLLLGVGGAALWLIASTIRTIWLTFGSR